MHDTKEQVVLTIVIVILALLILGFSFLFMLFYYNNKKRLMIKNEKQLKDSFEKQILETKIELQEETFNIISQEIHDSVGQSLSLAKVQISILDHKNDLDRELLGELKDSVSRAITDLRDIAKSLSSDRIMQSDLADTVTHEMQRISRKGYIDATVLKNGTEHPIPEQKKIILFRIIQEGLQNILKHANATVIEVTFDYLPTLLQIKICDNGVGFAPAKAEKSNGLGLNNMLKRAHLAGGKASIESIPGSGTQILIEMPYA